MIGNTHVWAARAYIVCVMVEKIDTKKLFSPVSSAGRVKGVKQRNTDAQQRDFNGELKEEEKEKKKGLQTGQTTVSPGSISEKGKGKEMVEGEDGGYQGSSSEKKTHDDIHGKLIDIII